MVQETRGVIACISSVMGSLQETTSGNAVLYRVSKAALNMVVHPDVVGNISLSLKSVTVPEVLEVVRSGALAIQKGKEILES
jgi:hypothetical protein